MREWRKVTVGRLRLAGAAAALLLFGLIGSDFLSGEFWARHAMLTSIIADLVVVLITVAVVNEYLDRRSERQWNLLAQYALLELALTARSAWRDIAAVAFPDYSARLTTEQAQRGMRTPEIARRISTRLEQLIDEGEHDEALAELMTRVASEGQEVLKSWSSLMINSRNYAPIFSRHVELQGRLAFLDLLISSGESLVSPTLDADPEARRRQKRDGLLSVLSTAAELEAETRALALRVVPNEWWSNRTDDLLAAARS